MAATAGLYSIIKVANITNARIIHYNSTHIGATCATGEIRGLKASKA